MSKGILGAILGLMPKKISGASSVAVALGPQGAPAGQKVTLSASSAQSAAIAGSWVDVIADVAAWVEIGSNPTAVVDTSYRIAAGITYRFPITSGNKVAGIAGGSGNLWIRAVQ